MDIGSKCEYPASELSNFAPHKFTIDGVECGSMEGFLQSLKFSDFNVQKEVCKLVGFAAKKRGKTQDWKKDQTLYWNGKKYKRGGIEYQLLLDEAYSELSKNSGFIRALLETKNATLTHSIGKRDIRETVLTEAEFCTRLTNLRTAGKNGVKMPLKNLEEL